MGARRIVVAVVALVVGCGGDAPSEAKVSEPARGIVQAEPSPEVVAPYEPMAAVPGVYGHVRIADPFALLVEVSDRLAPATVALALTPEAVRAAARAEARTPVARALAERLDLSRPIACAVLDPMQHAVPLACVFGASGGLPALVDALGPDGRTSGGPAGAVYEIDGVAVHLHALGDDVVVAFDATAFGDAAGYLEGLVRPGGRWDVELTVHAAPAIARYGAELELTAASLLVELAPMADDPAMRVVTRVVSRELGVVVPLVSRRGGAVVRELVDAGREIERLQVGLRIDDEGLRAAVHVHPRPESALQATIAARGALPPDLLDWLPRHTWLAAASAGTEPWLPQTRALLAEIAVGLVGDRLGLPPETSVAAWNTITIPDPGVYRGDALVAAFNGPGTWAGAAWIRPLHTGHSGTESWRSFVAAATAEALLGSETAAELDRIVQWSLHEDTRTIDEVGVDRWQVDARKAFVRKLRASLSDDEALAEGIVAWVEQRPALVAVDRFELAAHAAWVLAPGGGEGYAPRVMDAGRGTARADRAQLDARIATRPHLVDMLALSELDVLRFVHEILPPDLAEGIPAEAGRGLGDVFAGAWVTEEGHWIGEMTVGQAVLDVVRSQWP